MNSGVPCKSWRNRFSPNSTHRDPPASRCEKRTGAWGDPMASLHSPRLLLHFEVQLLPPPVPGLSLAKAPAKVFPTRRTLGLGVLDQRWWGHSSARPAGEGPRMRIREADPGSRSGVRVGTGLALALAEAPPASRCLGAHQRPGPVPRAPPTPPCRAGAGEGVSHHTEP